MNNKKKIMLPMIIGLLMVITVIGVTYAFFNYTRTGPVNAIRVGRIYFNHEEGDSISLQNVFPISSEQAETDTTNAKTLSISVIGDTDYDGGIEYVVTLDSVNNSKNIPITLEVSVDGTGLGTEEPNDYYTNRDNYTESKYKIEYNNRLVQDNHILVGYISPNVNKGNIEGINGTINIKAYVDSINVLISDTYPEGTVTIDGVEYYNGTPTTNKKVLTTEEWNSITDTNALSFKIKVEAREGIWVEKPSTPASCFATSTPGAKYVRNPNMDINTCVSKFTEMGVPLQEGETLENFCNGTGTVGGRTLQEVLDNNIWVVSQLTELETAGIITNTGEYIISITDYDANCGSDVVIPSKINTELVTYTRNPNMDINTCVNKFHEFGYYLEEGETYETYCNGTGTMSGNTLQEYLDNNYLDSSKLTELETAEIITRVSSTPIQATVISIGDGSFNTKNLTSVVIPNSIKLIEYGAFADNQLTSVTIPKSVTRIGEIAFYVSDTSNPNLKKIYNYTGQAFDWDSIIIGEYGDSFEEGIVSTSKGITKIVNYTVEKQNTCYTYGISNNSITIIDYDVSCGTDVVIPNTIDGLYVTTISVEAFANKNLASVIIPNSIKSIEWRAFADNQLTSITIPNGVIAIDGGAFGGNHLIGTLIIPDSVTEIGGTAFLNNNINKIIVPDAFYDANSSYMCKPNTSGISQSSDFSGKVSYLYSAAENGIIIKKIAVSHPNNIVDENVTISNKSETKSCSANMFWR